MRIGSVKSLYWAHRGKLDVPKERFVLYRDAGRDTDPTPVLGGGADPGAAGRLAPRPPARRGPPEGHPREPGVGLVIYAAASDGNET